MKTTRRKMLEYSVTGVAASLIPVVGVGNVGNHPHPHVQSYTPSHMISGIGVEHSFLEQESRKFAHMKDCVVVIEHRDPVHADSLETLAGFSEHVPIFVNKGNPIRELALRDLESILLGSVRNWKQLGWKDVEVEISANAGNHQRWKRAFGRIISRNFLDNSDDASMAVMNALYHNRPVAKGVAAPNVVWQYGYQYVAERMNSHPGALGVGLRPSFGRGFVPVRVDGQDLRSETYPIQAESYVNFRHDTAKAKPMAEDIVERMLVEYRNDEIALSGMLA